MKRKNEEKFFLFRNNKEIMVFPLLPIPSSSIHPTFVEASDSRRTGREGREAWQERRIIVHV